MFVVDLPSFVESKLHALASHSAWNCVFGWFASALLDSAGCGLFLNTRNSYCYTIVNIRIGVAVERRCRILHDEKNSRCKERVR